MVTENILEQSRCATVPTSEKKVGQESPEIVKAQQPEVLQRQDRPKSHPTTQELVRMGDFQTGNKGVYTKGVSRAAFI